MGANRSPSRSTRSRTPARIDSEQFGIAGNPAVGARGLYFAIVSSLGGVPRFHKATLIPEAANALAAQEAERGKRVVVVVDEAHLLGANQLKELRLLMNAEMDSHSPFVCLLVGQPTLRAHQARDLRRPRPALRHADRDAGLSHPGFDAVVVA